MSGTVTGVMPIKYSRVHQRLIAGPMPDKHMLTVLTSMHSCMTVSGQRLLNCKSF